MSEETATSERMRMAIVIVMCIGMFPLFLQRKLQALSYLSFIGVLAVVFVICLVVG